MQDLQSLDASGDNVELVKGSVDEMVMCRERRAAFYEEGRMLKK